MTNASLLTPAGRSAIATIRVQFASSADSDEHVQDSSSGDLHLSRLNQYFESANGKPLETQSIARIIFGSWGTAPSEEVVICRTSSDTLEIHCHGGIAAVERILDDLRSIGIPSVDWKDQERCRADTLQSECLEVLSRTTTARTAEIVLEQMSGILRDSFEKLIALCDGPRHELDAAINRLLSWSRFGLHISNPWSVVLTGRPNVGKSSLINALLGYDRAIVFDEPGTTRDVVTGQTAFEGWPVELADTAGVRTSQSEIEMAGIELGKGRLQNADLRIVVIDVGEPPHDDDFDLMKAWPDCLIIGHKSDRPNLWGDRLPAGALLVSSVTEEGIEQLQQAIVRRLIPEPPKPGTAIPTTARQVEILKSARLSKSIEEYSEVLHQLL
jgi:tRNA modification GTPase